MSYPDLGCFAECLTCELCADAPPPGEPDLFPDLEPDNPAFDFDFEPPDPDQGPDKWWEDWDLPSGPGVGGVDIAPTWDPWGITISGEF